MASHDRDIVDPGLRIARKAKAVRELVSLTETRRAYLRRRGGCRTGWDPMIDLLRNVLLRRKERPDFTGPRWLARALHVTAIHIPKTFTGKDRTVQSTSGNSAVPPLVTLTVIILPVGVQVEAAHRA